MTDEIAAIEARHQLGNAKRPRWCRCGRDWPCDTRKVLNELADARAIIADLDPRGWMEEARKTKARMDALAKRLREPAEQHDENVRLAERARILLAVEVRRQLDAQSEPDDYWTGWNDALDAALLAALESDE